VQDVADDYNTIAKIITLDINVAGARFSISVMDAVAPLRSNDL